MKTVKKRLVKEAEDTEEVEVEVTDKEEIQDEAPMSDKEIGRTVGAMTDGQFNKVVNTVAEDDSLSKIEKMLVVIDLYRARKKEVQYRAIGKVLGLSHAGAVKVEERALKKLRKYLKSKGVDRPEDFTGKD